MLRTASRRLRATPQLRLCRPLSSRASSVLDRLSLDTSSTPQPGVFAGKWRHGRGEELTSHDPATGEVIGKVAAASAEDVEEVLGSCRQAFEEWRMVPAPKRGEVLRDIGNALRRAKKDLGALVTLEMGKILPEGLGEVQEAIDVCDFAVGLSRIAPGGQIIPSERPRHLLQEVAHPLGTVGVLTAFNFPEAVFAWNASLACITGNATVWKPAPSTPLVAIATTKIVASVLEAHRLPGALAALVCGGAEAGSAIVDSPSVDMVSFTGSEATGGKVAQKVQSRFGKVLLELGGNNAAVVMPSSDIDLALRAIVFGSIGTAGQRCTSTRRLLLHESIADDFTERLLSAYKQFEDRVGHGLDSSTLVGPLHNAAAVEKYEKALEECRSQGGEILAGGERLKMTGELEGGHFVRPTVVRWDGKPLGGEQAPEIVKKETFAPILHVGTFESLDGAVAQVNGVDQALSSSLFSRDIGDTYLWTGPSGSRCGIVNVNAGTSGAEIGGAFGGNYATGWGRESGGDAWKQYCRWSTCTINYSDEMPLAQGIEFN